MRLVLSWSCCGGFGLLCKAFLRSTRCYRRSGLSVSWGGPVHREGGLTVCGLWWSCHFSFASLSRARSSWHPADPPPLLLLGGLCGGSARPATPRAAYITLILWSGEVFLAAAGGLGALPLCRTLFAGQSFGSSGLAARWFHWFFWAGGLVHPSCPPALALVESTTPHRGWPAR